jgi:hypothetical protein
MVSDTRAIRYPGLLSLDEQNALIDRINEKEVARSKQEKD